MFTDQDKTRFEREGFAIEEGVFNQEEIALLLHLAQTQDRVKEARAMPDREGRPSRISLSTQFTEDVWGHLSRMPRVVRRAEFLLGEEVYHWHSKIMVKDARVGGAWEWHQDYGYWYHDDPPFPRLISAMLAITDADRENGCLSVLKGSHLCGRIDHSRAGSQSGADPDRVKVLLERLPVVDCELKSGSMLYFHCNLLHSSAPNLSDRPRLSYICCYNALSNPPLTKPGHGPCVPIAPTADDLDAWR